MQKRDVFCNVAFSVTFDSFSCLKVMKQRVWREYFVFIYFLFQLLKLLPLLHLSFCPQHCFHPTLMGEFLSINLDLFCAWLIGQTCILSRLNRSLAMVQDAPPFGSARARLHNPKGRVMIFKHWRPLARPMTQVPVLQPLGKGGWQSPPSLFSFCPVASYKKDERRKVKVVMETLFQQICSLDGFTCWKSEKNSRNCWLTTYFWLIGVSKFKHFS